MPFFARPLVFPVMKCLLDEKMIKALGYTNSPALLKIFVRAAMKIRAFALRKITFKKYPSFVCIEPTRTYKKEYELEKLSPGKYYKEMATQRCLAFYSHPAFPPQCH